MKQNISEKILWGTHPAHSLTPIKICKNPTKKQFNMRRNQGWNLEICETGEKPLSLLTAIKW